MRPSFGDERSGVLGHRRGVAEEVAVGRHADGPVEELLAVLARQPERDADRLHRHVRSHLFIEVGPAERLDAQEVLVDDGLDDVALPVLHLDLGEGRLEQQAHAAMLGLVHADHALADGHVERGAVEPFGGEHARLAQRVEAVLVRVHRDRAVFDDAVEAAAHRVREVPAQAPVLHRALPEKFVEDGVRVVDETRAHGAVARRIGLGGSDGERFAVVPCARHVVRNGRLLVVVSARTPRGRHTRYAIASEDLTIVERLPSRPDGYAR